MCTYANSEHVVLMTICLNNAGVKAFEWGDLDKAIRFMTWARQPDVALSNLERKDRRMSKKILKKVIKSQARAFLPNQSFELRRSTRFGKRRTSRGNPPLKQVTDPTGQSPCYSFRRLLSIRASNSQPISCQTSQEQLGAVVLANLAICHHSYSGDISLAKHSYELAAAAASERGHLLIQLVVWNNLLQLHSDYLFEEEAARACMVQVERILSDPGASGLLSALSSSDRRGFLLNAILFSHLGTTAPAA
ncbi:hypothetical protein MHU86_4343 [Fragilaria crotonensis]|nr:hypothetical protein MHU86_4343 [Fragilaria crotonensis]